MTDRLTPEQAREYVRRRAEQHRREQQKLEVRPPTRRRLEEQRWLRDLRQATK